MVLHGSDSFRFGRRFSTLRESLRLSSDATRHGRVRLGRQTSTRERRPACGRPPNKLQTRLPGVLGSEVKFQSELKLARIECCCRPAVVMTVTRALLESVDVVDERRRSPLVESIEQVE